MAHDMELYTKLSRLQWLLQRQRMQAHAEHGPAGDPTRGQGRVLAALRLQPELATKDLSYLLGIRQQSLNELLNKLERRGFVVREPSPADRRVMLVKLTEKGKSAPQPQRTDISDIFSCLTPEEQGVFGQYLDRVIAALEEQLTAEDREQVDAWVRAARSRMGNEQFERLMAAWGGRPRHGGPRRNGGWPDEELFFHGGYHTGRDNPDRAAGPGGMPGAEGFDAEHGGLHPGDDGTPPPPPPPPPPPTSPHDHEDPDGE